MNRSLLLAVSALLLSSTISADVLELKNGKTFEGTLKGKDGDNVQFESDGISMTVNSADVKNISLGSSPDTSAAAAPQSEPGASTQTSATPSASSTDSGRPMVPAGTRVVIKLAQPLDSRQVNEGHKFIALLESAIVVDGVSLVGSGAAVHGIVHGSQSSRRLAGTSSIKLSLTDIKVNDQLQPIKTSGIEAVTDNTAKSTVGKTLRGAAIGALINGKEGARDGAKVGGGAAILSQGNQVHIPAGTLLEFTLAEAAKL